MIPSVMATLRIVSSLMLKSQVVSSVRDVLVEVEVWEEVGVGVVNVENVVVDIVSIGPFSCSSWDVFFHATILQCTSSMEKRIERGNTLSPNRKSHRWPGYVYA